jgi:hypothetical protein
MANFAETNNAAEVPTIIGSVRINKTVYGPGSEEALAKVLTKDQAKRLTKAQVIFGFGAKAETEETDDDAPKRGRKPKGDPEDAPAE